MKKLILLLLLIPSLCFAADPMQLALSPAVIGAAGAGGAAGCTVSAQGKALGADLATFAYDAASQSAAGVFTKSVTEAVCELDIYLKTDQAHTGTLTVQIRNVAAGVPTTVVASADATIDKSNITTSEATFTVTFTPDVTLTDGNDYAITFLSSNYANPGYLFYYCNGSGVPYTKFISPNPVTTWTQNDLTLISFRFRKR